MNFNRPSREWAKWVSEPVNGASEWSERSEAERCGASEWSERCERTNVATRRPGTNPRSYKIVKTSDLVKCLSWCICYKSRAKIKKSAWKYRINSSIIAKNKYFYVFFLVKNCIYRLQTYEKYVKSMATVATQMLLPPKVSVKEFFTEKNKKKLKNTKK